MHLNPENTNINKSIDNDYQEINGKDEN